MSAWYALTALGFHMVAPGSGIYHVNTPLFRRAEIRLSKEYHPCAVSDTLVIETAGNPDENVYIRGITVNGKPLDRAWLTWDEIANGGVIRYELSNEPCTDWAVQLPPSLSK